MKKLLVVALLLSLAGCAIAPVKPVPQVIVETHYVIKIPPAQLMTLPNRVPNINVDTASQYDVSSWLIARNAYTLQLEKQLQDIAIFFKQQEAQLNKTPIKK